MPLSDEEVARLKEAATAVGRTVGRRLEFVVAPNSEFIGLTVDGTFIVGPDHLANLAAHDVELELEAIRSGHRIVTFEQDGTPRLLHRE